MMKEATSADVLSLHSRGEEATDLENNQGNEEVLKPCVRNNRLKIQQSYHFREFFRSVQLTGSTSRQALDQRHQGIRSYVRFHEVC